MNAGPNLEEGFQERRECFATLGDEHITKKWETAFGLRVTLLPRAEIRVADLGRPILPAKDLKLEAGSS